MRATLVLAMLLAAGVSLPAAAQITINTDINFDPPEPRYEAVPAARPGYVWAPGYWAWDGHRRDWTEGRWVAERPGYIWVADRWDRYDNGWRFARGHWATDPHRGRDWGHDDDRHEHHDNGKHKGRGH